MHRPTSWEVLNVLSAVASRVGGKLIGLVFIVVLARISTPTEFASYSYLIALALLFVILTDSGMGAAAGRDVARGDIGLATVYREGVAGAAAGGALGAIALCAVGLLDSGPGSEGMALAFAALFVAFNAVFNFQASILRSSGRHWVESALQVVGGALFVIVGVAIVLSGLGIGALMAAFAIKEATMVCLAQAYLPDPRRAARKPDAWRGLLASGIVMSVATILFAVTLRMSQIALGNIGTVDELASYSVSYRFLEATGVVCAAIGVGIGPLLCARFAGDEVRARRSVVKALAVAGGAALVVTPVAVAVTPFVVSTAFGERYRVAGPAAQLFVATIPIMLILFVSWFALLAQRRERIVVAAAAGGALVAGASTLLVVHSQDAMSAAIGAALGVTTMSAICVSGVLWRPKALSRPGTSDRATSAVELTLARGAGE
jgi:O-antigen/teichoic acid export membrane protein